MEHSAPKRLKTAKHAVESVLQLRFIDLPFDIMQAIFAFLSIKDVLNVSEVNSVLRKVVVDDETWQNLMLLHCNVCIKLPTDKTYRDCVMVCKPG